MEWSGVEWSGVEWSGVEWSGVEWSGVEFFFICCGVTASQYPNVVYYFFSLKSVNKLLFFSFLSQPHRPPLIWILFRICFSLWPGRFSQKKLTGEGWLPFFILLTDSYTR